MEIPAKMSHPPSALYDLLVVLGTSRFGTDWPNVSASVRVALGPLETRDPGCEEPPSAAECEERYRALVEGVPSELSALAARLQVGRLETLTAARAGLVERIKELCQQLPPGHPARPAAAFAEPPGTQSDVAQGAAATPADGPGGGAADASAAEKTGGRGGAGRGRPSDAALENELEETWVQIAEEDERNARRATVSTTLNKMLQAVAKHKWAYPFKRPVTDKEAPDYKDIITNVSPMTQRARTHTHARAVALCCTLHARARRIDAHIISPDAAHTPSPAIASASGAWCQHTYRHGLWRGATQPSSSGEMT
jgi:hypothetical protein